jgi:hypothetical protein
MINYDLLAKKADLLLDSENYKYATSGVGNLYDALSDASHKLYAAKAGTIKDRKALDKAVKLTQAIPESNIKDWIESEDWRELV